jgi:malate dehydrogenase (quinone)
MKRDRSLDSEADILLIGAGIMSATLGTMLRELNPGASIEILERMDATATESSSAWNNAGTGHAGNCELNYTVEKEDGSVDISKAVAVNEAFEISRQLWAYLVEKKTLRNPRSFINPVAHMSFVTGDRNCIFLRKRFEAMSGCPLFKGMEFSESAEEIGRWAPLVIEGRDPAQRVAATRITTGTDVNFGALTKELLESLKATPRTIMHCKSEVADFKRRADGSWSVLVRDLDRDARRLVRAKFIFIGAGGGALKLLEQTEIPESKGFGGVPVGGEWLITKNQALVARHEAKVYGQAAIGAPPMSVPHLDTRVIDGEKALLFGPFATFSTKFLKNGSWLDFPRSFTFSNFMPVSEAGLKNLPLAKYLVSQLMLSTEDRLDALREYFPKAEGKDWYREEAGQRVQVVKDIEGKGGTLEFGTEVVAAGDGSVAALLGASPGASTAAEIMLRVLQKCMPAAVATPEWQAKLKKMIPSYGEGKLHENVELLRKVREWNSRVLGLPYLN